MILQPLEDEGVDMEETEDDSKELPSIAGSLGKQKDKLDIMHSTCLLLSQKMFVRYFI